MRVVVVAVAFAMLPGCASPEPAPVVDAAGQSAGDPPGTPAASESVARFSDLPAVDETRFANGTFRFEEHGRLPGAPPVAPTSPGVASLDVTDLVPAGLPTVVFADARAEMPRGDLDLWVSMADEDFRTGSACSPRGGSPHVEPGLVHASREPVVVNLLYDEAETAAEVPYVLSARVVSDPTVVPGGIAVGLELPAGVAAFEIELVGARRECMFDLDVPNLMVWGPDDAFLGHFRVEGERTRVSLPADPEAGEYVLILSQGGRGMRVRTPTTEPAALRALPLEWLVSEPRRGASADAADWTAEYARVPILAGVLFESATVATDATVRLASPAGEIFSETVTGGPWLSAPALGDEFRSSFGWDGGFGVPALVAGTYEASVRFARGAGPDPVEVRDLAAFWERSPS